jgi:cytochrome c-type biogenesis protein CcmH
MAVYYAVGRPAAPEQTAGTDAADTHDIGELAAGADRIKAHLKQTPNDLKGWTLLGRSLAALGRFPEALDAYNHAIVLSPGDAGLHAELGEVLVLQAHGRVTPEAEAAFNKAPDDPRSRYYGAEAALQRSDPAAAKQKLQALLAAAPADAPWRQAVADRLAELSQNGSGTVGGPASGPTAPAGGPSASAPGPTAQDMAAAQSMTPEQQQAMIRGMVERLAQRLEQHPDDKAGWERLAHAYDVLGEPDKAQAARARATAAPNGAPAAASSAAPAPASPPAPAPPR